MICPCLLMKASAEDDSPPTQLPCCFAAVTNLHLFPFSLVYVFIYLFTFSPIRIYSSPLSSSLIPSPSLSPVSTKFQVSECNWPSRQAPSLHNLFAVCKNMHNWLKQNPKNVCVITCSVGRHHPPTHLSILFIYCYLKLILNMLDAV